MAGAFSTFVIVHGVLGPLHGWLAGRVGPRWIILVGGGVLGAGLVLVAETQAQWHPYATFGGIIALVLAGRHPASVMPYVYAILIGLGYAATAPLTPAAASDLFSGPKFSTIFGTLHVSNALGASTGAWIGGRIFDQTGSYLFAFGLALLMAVFSASLPWIVAPRRPHPPPRASRQP